MNRIRSISVDKKRAPGFAGLLDSERVRWWANTLAIPIALGTVAHFYQRADAERAERAQQVESDRLRQAQKQADERALGEKRLALYTELLSKRETSDTEVRRAIFDKVLERYLQPGSKNVENKLVALDLMSTNFHESLDLSPLFWQLHRVVTQDRSPNELGERRLKELARIAGEVKARQLDALAMFGDVHPLNVDLNDQLRPGEMVKSEEFSMHFADPINPTKKTYRQTFKVDVLQTDFTARRVRLRVVIGDSGTKTVEANDEARSSRELVVFPWADLYDFPLVTFIRISADERIAVILESIDSKNASASLIFIYYPSSRSGVKDKPFIDEVVQNLLKPISP